MSTDSKYVPPNESTMDMPIDYFDDLPTQEDAAPATLERLTLLAIEAKDLEAQIEADQVALEEKMGKLTVIKRQRIPTIMDELGMESFKLADGSEVTVKDDVKCSITEANRPAAWVWLEEREYDGIIKTSVSCAFSKGEMELAKQAMEALRTVGFTPSLDRSVHPQTLKSFVKERLEHGENIPIDVFGIFEFKEAKIKLPGRAAKKTR
jgi:hypothetical protein